MDHEIHGHRICRLQDVASPAYQAQLQDSIDKEKERAKTCWSRLKRRRRQLCSGYCMCYVIYVAFFITYVLLVPFFVLWIVGQPLPTQYWHKPHAYFPMINEDYLEETFDATVQMSPIPVDADTCNFSFGSTGGVSSNMNFPVDIWLDAPDLARQANAFTVFPALFASHNFENWWVAADRRHASPWPFFQNLDAMQGRRYEYVTESCTRAPSVPRSGVVSAGERFTSAKSYVLACVAWAEEKVEWHQGQETSYAMIKRSRQLTATDLGQYCDAVGGVGGLPCSGNPSVSLPGCIAGRIQVGLGNSSSVAGVRLPGANFQGKVSIAVCEQNQGDSESSDGCITSMTPFANWPCHSCNELALKNNLSPSGFMEELPDPKGVQSDADALEYRNKIYNIITERLKFGSSSDREDVHIKAVFRSLPRFKVSLRGLPILPTDNSSDPLGQPQVYIFTSPVDASAAGPAGMISGKWTALYPNNKNLVASTIAAAAPPPGKARRRLKSVHDHTNNDMTLMERNRITIRSPGCLGPRGPLYLVACAMNSSSYERLTPKGTKFEDEIGDSIGKPPFNDRCIAVGGRCAHACTDDNHPMPYCDANGNIQMDKLVKPLEAPKKKALLVSKSGLFAVSCLITSDTYGISSESESAHGVPVISVMLGMIQCSFTV